MGKDFDNDDFSWQRGKKRDEGDENDESSEDFPELDWLTDDSDPSSKTASSGDKNKSGVTGQLPWLRDRDADADSSQSPGADDLDFDWLGGSDDQPAKPDSKRLGVTGQLSWLGGKDDAAEEPSRPDPGRTGVTGQLDWRKTSIEDQLEAAEKAAGVQRDLSTPVQPSTPAAPADDEADEVPDWLKGAATADDSADDFSAFGPATDDFLYADDGDENDSTTSADVPDWLKGAAPSPASSADFDFSAIGDTDDDDEIDADADNWADAFDFDTADSSATGGPTGSAETPDWLSGLSDDDNDDSDTPDWLTETGITRAVNLPPEDEAEEPEVDDAFSSLFADLEDNTLISDHRPSIPAVPEDDFDLLGELTADTGGKTGLTDLLNASALPDEDEFDDSDTGTDDDFFSEFMAAQGQTDAAELTTDDSMDWLSDLQPLDAAPPLARQSSPSSPASQVEDVDDFLASLDTGEFTFDQDAGDLLPDDSDSLAFDDLFADQTFDRLDRASAASPDLPSAERPDWLSNVSISEVSAAAIVRKQPDRPLEDLSDRLHFLREEGEQIPGSGSGETDLTMTDLIPDLKDALAPAPVEVSAAGITDRLNLSAEQSRKVAILTALTGASAAAADPALSEAVQTQAARRARLKLDRLVITLLVAAAVILPFFGILKVGDLPPQSFGTGSAGQNAFNQINNLRAGQPVLFAAEYGATGAGELDTMTDVLLRHLIMRQAHPVIVSSNPVGLLRAQTRMETAAGTTYRRNTDYFIGRYIPGANIGLRGFSQDIAALTGTDFYGDPTGLDITTLNDFALIVVVAEDFDSVRAWAEQIAPQTTTPIIFATGYAASPLTAPYTVGAGLNALLVGYRDTYTYASQLDFLVANGLVPAVPTASPTVPVQPTQPTAITTREPTPLKTPGTAVPAALDANTTATETGSELPTDAVTSEATNAEAATETPVIASTDTPAASESPAASATPAATETPTLTMTPTIGEITPSSAQLGKINSDQPVNVRSGPGRTFAIVAVAQPDELVTILDRNPEGTWYQIRLADGTEGWISSTLLEISTAALPGSIIDLHLGVVMGFGVGSGLVAPVAQASTPVAATETSTDTESEATGDGTAEVSATETERPPTATRTPSPTLTPTPTSTPVIVAASNAASIPYQQERWYGMTLGTIMIIVIIIAGNVLSLLRRAGVARAMQRSTKRSPSGTASSRRGRS